MVELGRRLGVCRGAIYRFERGKAEPSEKTLRRLDKELPKTD